MRLFLLRHGQAEPHKIPDETRELTEKGRHQTADITKHYLLDTDWNAIWVSPFVRAQQTAQIVLENINKKHPHSKLKLTTINGITPEDSPKRALDLFTGHETETLLIVSHQPFLGALAGLLVYGNLQSVLDIHTSGLIELNMPIIGVGQAELVYTVSPK